MKAIYNRHLLDNSGNDHNAFWRTMKKILRGGRKAASPNISIGGTLTSDKNLISDSFNKFFLLLGHGCWSLCGLAVFPVAVPVNQFFLVVTTLISICSCI